MPGSITGKVVHIADGDTLTLLDEQNQQRIIRLSDIDAPEAQHGKSRPGQPFASVAKAHLVALALGKPGQAKCYDIDARMAADGTTRARYICHLTVDGTDMSLAMVDAGLSMVYRAHKAYVRNPAVYAHEDQARAAAEASGRTNPPPRPGNGARPAGSRSSAPWTALDTHPRHQRSYPHAIPLPGHRNGRAGAT